jgi:hypothetical protein
MAELEKQRLKDKAALEKQLIEIKHKSESQQDDPFDQRIQFYPNVKQKYQAGTFTKAEAEQILNDLLFESDQKLQKADALTDHVRTSSCNAEYTIECIFSNNAG